MKKYDNLSYNRLVHSKNGKTSRWVDDHVLRTAISKGDHCVTLDAEYRHITLRQTSRHSVFLMRVSVKTLGKLR